VLFVLFLEDNDGKMSSLQISAQSNKSNNGTTSAVAHALCEKLDLRESMSL
jgi:hypothetical protein